MKLKILIILVMGLLGGVFLGAVAVKYTNLSTLLPDRDSADHSDNGLESSSPSHGHEENTSQVTIRGDRLEIFLEHPFVVTDTPVEFVTHVTDLVTLQPRRAGPVIFELQHDAQTSFRHTEPSPTREGIYIPELAFSRPGEWQLSLIIPIDDKEHRLELPGFLVYGSEDEADHAATPEEPAGFCYLKEQQWKVPTKSEPVRLGKVGGREVLTIPESAVVEQDGQSVAFVQVAGETFAKHPVKLGNRENGSVEIQSGLAADEYVVSQGVEEVASAEFAEPSSHAHAPGGRAHENEALQLDEQQLKKFDIETDTVNSGKLDVHVNLPGEIKFNADRLAHIIPSAAGIVREVFKKAGDRVAEGEIIAWLESAKLGEAKVNYLAKLSEVSCCSIELIRTQEIHENTLKLLEILTTTPSLESLQQMNEAAMGKNRSDLISAYAEYIFAQKSYLREKQLLAKEITSENDYLRAESSFKKADALYAAVRDRIAFEVKRNLLDARRGQQVREMDLKSAERHLYVLGLSSDNIQELELLAQSQKSFAREEECTDPNCAQCVMERGKTEEEGTLDVRAMNERLAWYPLRAPFAGTIVDKHITLGEVVKDDIAVFVIADLSTVWVDLHVYLNDLPYLKQGQSVVLSAGAGIPEARGVIDYLDPTVDQNTRTARARVVLPNRSGVWRPGLFVTATITIEKATSDIMIDKSNIQYLEDQPCVFIQDEHGFEPRSVTLGRSNNRYVEVTAGLKAGERIVTKNSFRLKAELVKRQVGDIGHGHAH